VQAGGGTPHIEAAYYIYGSAKMPNTVISSDETLTLANYTSDNSGNLTLLKNADVWTRTFYPNVSDQVYTDGKAGDVITVPNYGEVLLIEK
jgi:hypothetical protein